MPNKRLCIIQSASVRWFNACAYYGVSLSQALHGTGHDVTLAAPVESPAYNHACALGLKTLDLPSIGTHNPVAYIHAAAVCRFHAQNTGVDVVNTINGFDHSFWTIALAGTGIPVLRTFCNRIVKRANPGKRLLMRHTSGILVSCKPVRDKCSELYGTDKTKIPVINGGVDTDHFSPEFRGNGLRSSLGIPDDALVFGIVGRFSPVKGHKYFFKAASGLLRSHPNSYFLVSGSPAQLSTDDIRLMISDAGIADNTVVLGRSEDVRELIATCDVGVIASLDSEVICRIAMEYMAMGRPVIAADTNVLPEIVTDGQTGIVVPAGDFLSMQNAMETLASNRNHLDMLGKQAHQRALDEYSLASFANKTVEHYKQFML